MSMNHITLMGTIIRGPEFRMTPNGIPTCNLSIAVTRPARTEGAPEITDYIRVVTWRTLAEKVNEGVQKGELVVIEGRLTARSYEKDGQRRKTVEVEASAVEPVRGASKAGAAKQSSDEYGGYEDDFSDFETAAPAPAPARKPATTKPAAPAADLDDEIPF